MSVAAAFFDVDGTLVGRHIVHQFMHIRRRLLSPALRPLWTGVFLAKAPYYLVLDKVSRTRLNEVFYRNYAGMSSAAVRSGVESCFHEVILPNLFPQGRVCIAEHRAAGRRIVLATGSIDFIIKPLADLLGADDVFAPRLIERAGRFTGELDGPAVGHHEKARRIRVYAESHDIDLGSSFAYGDSIADLPMLELVGHPCVINPDKALSSAAAQRGWPIQHWSVSATNGRGRQPIAARSG